MTNGYNITLIEHIQLHSQNLPGFYEVKFHGFFSYERCIITTFGLIDRDFELGVWYRLCLFNLLQNT